MWIRRLPHPAAPRAEDNAVRIREVGCHGYRAPGEREAAPEPYHVVVCQAEMEKGREMLPRILSAQRLEFNKPYFADGRRSNGQCVLARFRHLWYPLVLESPRKPDT